MSGVQGKIELNYFRVADGNESRKSKVVIKIDDTWYDLTQWRHVHPGGPGILDHIHEQDATEAFYSIHSKDAVARLARIPKAKPEQIPKDFPPTSKTLVAFREFREQLEKDGWFERALLWDFFYFSHCFFLCALGTWLTLGCTFWGRDLLAILAIGLGMEQAGWIGHDYTHGRDKPNSFGMCYYMSRLSATLINGFCPSWWSYKHNTHHCYPNVKETDLDIQNEPLFHLWFPSENEDTWIRQYQHIYFFPVVGFLYVSWRMQSAKDAWRRREWDTLALMAIGYAWLLLVLPLHVAIGAVYFGGFLVGVIVTASHQSEEIMEKEEALADYDFVTLQFRSTRDAYNHNFFTHYLWGGMQYQLIHHLFPTLPKYRYPALRPLVIKFAEENGLEYRMESESSIILRNLRTLYKYSQQYREKGHRIGPLVMETAVGS